MLRRLVAACAIVLAACSGTPSTAAVVDGVEFTGEELEALSPDGDREEADRIRDINLLILHHILTAGAAGDFDLVVSNADVVAAFEKRVNAGDEDVDDLLVDRGTTRARVMLEAELDVIRQQVEALMVESDQYGFDFDAAYRSFLGVNSLVCIEGLRLLDLAVAADMAAAVDAGGDIDSLRAAYPDATEVVELGCTNPVEHGTTLAPIALDGEVGVAYLRETDDGTPFVVQVTERDAPPADEVREEVLAVGRERQAPGLFDAWAVGVIQAADVEVDESIGEWATSEDTGEVPTVVAH